MCFILNLSFEKLILNLNNELSPKQKDEYLKLCERLSLGEPFEYISGVCEFLGRDFMVNSSVLIPRVETEILVQKCLRIAKRKKFTNIFDIGTGSGIIAISLALSLPDAIITAADINKNALEIAKENAKKFAVKNISFIQSDLLENFNQNADIIISNPPYIARDYPLSTSVLFEPSVALFGGIKGDEILLKLIKQAKTRCKYLACEIGYDQKSSIQNALKTAGFKARFYKDLAGFDRGFIACIS